MNIVMHYPISTQDIHTLRKKVATVHAEAVIQHIGKLPCSKEQRLKLYDEIKRAYRDER